MKQSSEERKLALNYGNLPTVELAIFALDSQGENES